MPLRSSTGPRRMLRPVLFGALFGLVAAASAHAQTATIRGFVTDYDDGQPLVGVNVTLQGPGGPLVGAATDPDGLYVVSRVAPGRYLLRATFIGYQTHVDTLDLAAGDLLTRNFRLRASAAELDEVVVETEREAAGAAGLTAGLQTVRSSDIDAIPAPDVSGDLVSYLAALPGVVTTGDQGGQLFIRGGEPTQNLVLLDGMLLYQPFHLVGFYSAFPSDILNTTDVYAGGFGGRYGGRLSSVIDISTRKGNNRRLAGSVSAAPFVSSALLEGPLWPGRVSFLLSGRTSVIEQGAARLVDQELPYTFNDQFAKLHATLGQNSQVSVSALRTYDRGTVGEADTSAADTREAVTWKNQAVGARYLLLPATMPVSAELLFSTSRVENIFGLENQPSRTSSAQQYAMDTHVTHYAGALEVGWGLFVHTTSVASKLAGQFQNVRTEREFITEAGLYFAPEFTLGGLRLQPGVRVQAFPSKGQTFVEPRFRTVWNAGIHRLSAAAGIYHQQMVGLNDRRMAGDVFTAWTSAPDGLVPEAVHFLAGYQIRPAAWLELAVEGFYKRLTDLSVPEWTAFPRFTTTLQPADGRVEGVDLRLELTRAPFYGFVTYGLARVAYEARQQNLQHWYDEADPIFPPPHDRRHQVNALGAVELLGFDLSVRWQFGSGLPFSEAIGFDTFVLLDGPTDAREEPGRPRVLYGTPYGGRLPAYHRLDVSLEREVTFGRHAAATLHAGLINGYDRRNLFYLDLFTLSRVDQMPLIPSFGLKVSFR